jgi:ribosomal-protein-alanine N-acetyltransferase
MSTTNAEVRSVYPVRIDGERIYLRDFMLEDLDMSMAVAGDPDVTASLSFDTRSHDEQAVLLVQDIESAKGDPRLAYYLAIIEREADNLIGFTRIALGKHRNGELGGALRKDRWRQRYAIEAARLMLDFAFETLGLHRVQAACGPDNLASQATLERLGFTYEGRMRDHVFTNGAWRDSLLYSLLDAEHRT